MEILVTGANGFIGRCLCKELLANHHHVVGLGKGSMDEDVEFYDIDITNEAEIEKVFQKHSFDVVIHLAAVTFHDDIVNQKRKTLSISMQGTEILATLFNKYCNNAKFIYTSTGKIYGGGVVQPINELTPPNPKNALGKSKYLTERLIDYYSTDNMSNKFIVLRMFNIYGYGQRNSFVIPYIIGELNSTKPIKLGNVEDKRDYLNVNDLVKLFAAIINKPAKELDNFNIFNVGSGLAYSVNDILAMLEKDINRKIPIEIDSSRLRQDETAIEYADNSLVKNTFNWGPQITLEDGLKDMLEKSGVVK